MKTKITFSTFLLGLFLWSGCYRAEVVKEEIKIPEMAGKTCYDAIAGALSGKGVTVTPINSSYTEGIFVEYNKMQQAQKNLEHSVAELGFTANEIAAYPNVKRPAGCN